MKNSMAVPQKYKYSQESPILRLVWGIDRETFLKGRFEIPGFFCIYLVCSRNLITLVTTN